MLFNDEINLRETDVGNSSNQDVHKLTVTLCQEEPITSQRFHREPISCSRAAAGFRFEKPQTQSQRGFKGTKEFTVST